jgi:hypothetical protein
MPAIRCSATAFQKSGSWCSAFLVKTPSTGAAERLGRRGRGPRRVRQLPHLRGNAGRGQRVLHPLGGSGQRFAHDRLLTSTDRPRGQKIKILPWNDP